MILKKCHPKRLTMVFLREMGLKWTKKAYKWAKRDKYGLKNAKVVSLDKKMPVIGKKKKWVITPSTHPVKFESIPDNKICKHLWNCLSSGSTLCGGATSISDIIFNITYYLLLSVLPLNMFSTDIHFLSPESKWL